MEALMVIEIMKRMDTKTLEDTSAEEIEKAVEMIFEDGVTIEDFIKQAD